MPPAPKEYFDLPEDFRNPLRKKGFLSFEILALHGILITYPPEYLMTLPPKSSLEIAPQSIVVNSKISQKGCYSGAQGLENRGYLDKVYRISNRGSRSEVRYVLNVAHILNLLEDIK